MGGRNPNVTNDQIRKRIKHAFKLRIDGFSIQEIHSKLNGMADNEGWGKISIRQLKRDFAQKHAVNILTGVENKDYSNSLREIQIQKLEIMIKKITDRLEAKTDWKPYEYEKTTKMAFDMLVKITELNGWDYSKQSIYVEQKNKSDDILDIYDRASEELQNEAPEAVQSFIELIDGIADKLEEEEKNQQ